MSGHVKASFLGRPETVAFIDEKQIGMKNFR